MVKKVGFSENFKTVQTPITIRLTAVFANTNFFAVFQANILNKNEVLAIIGATIV